MRGYIVIMVLLGILAGCGPWVKTDGPLLLADQNFTVDLPAGWMRSNSSKYLLITRDGVLLQSIEGHRYDLAAEKQFAHTKKRLTRDMLPQEAAEVVVDDLQSDPDFVSFDLEGNEPATLGGNPGFKLRFSHTTKDGLPCRSVYYGMLSDGWYYVLSYSAPRRYYFDRDVNTFESVAKSFRLVK